METPVFSGNGAPGAVDFIILYLAAKILQVAGFDAEGTARILKEVYGAEVEPSRVEEWFSTVPKDIERRPALLRFIQTLAKDKLWALRYLAGAALGDADRYGELRVKDLSFARAYAKALAIVTGDPSSAAVREGRYGYHTRCCRPLAYFIRKGLWKVLASLDKLDEKKHFLSGLMDAEGSLSPRIDSRYKALYEFQVMFCNSDTELAEFVRASLEDLGFNPRIRVMRSGRRSVINGKVAVRKKPLYMVHAIADFSKIEALARCLSLSCERKRKLLEFFLSVRNLPPRQRYELFKRCWRKIRGKWWPTSELHLDQAQQHSSRPLWRRTAKMYVVLCPECGEQGTLSLRSEATRLRICLIHNGTECELDSLETEEEYVKCKKCGKLGRLYVVADRYEGSVRVRVEHYIGGKRKKKCHLKQMPLRKLITLPQPSTTA